MPELLETLTLADLAGINEESLSELVNTAQKLLMLSPGVLCNLNFSALSSEKAHGDIILNALCNSRLTSIRNLDLSKNPSWLELGYFEGIVRRIIEM